MIRTLIGLGLATSVFALAAPGIAAQAASAPAATTPPVIRPAPPVRPPVAAPATPAPSSAPVAAPASAPAATPTATTAQVSEASSSAVPAHAISLPFDRALTGEIKPATQEGCAAPEPTVKVYHFTVEADSRVEITMTADDFDTILEIGKMDGCTFTSLGSNDDGAGPDDGLNSRLVAHLREAGTYVVHARGIQDDSAGKFELKMRRLPAPAGAPTPIVIALGGKVEGELGPGSATIADDTGGNASEEEASVIESGRPYMLYSLTGEAGQAFLLQLESDEFDPIVEIGTMSPLGYSVAASNDDGGEEGDGLNSRLPITFRTAGTMLIRVSPLSADSGKYTLRVLDPKVVAEEARIAAEREAERQSRRERRRRR